MSYEDFQNDYTEVDDDAALVPATVRVTWALYEREFKRTPTREELLRFTQAFIAGSPEVKVEK